MVFWCVSVLFVCFFVLSPRSFRRLLQPRIKAAYTEKVFRNGGKPGLGGSPKSRRGEMGADRRRVCGVGERHAGKKNRKKQTKKTKTWMRYVTNAAADGEDGERLGRENAMSRLIRLIGNLGAADFQGFVFFLRWSLPKPRSVTKGASAARKQINK